MLWSLSAMLLSLSQGHSGFLYLSHNIWTVLANTTFFPAWKFSSDTMCHLPLWYLHGETNTSSPIWDHWVYSHSIHVQCGNPTRSQSLSEDFLFLTHFILRNDQGSYTHVCEGNNQTTAFCPVSEIRFKSLPVCRWWPLLIWLPSGLIFLCVDGMTPIKWFLKPPFVLILSCPCKKEILASSLFVWEWWWLRGEWFRSGESIPAPQACNTQDRWMVPDIVDE